jgi:hypothetical protein
MNAKELSDYFIANIEALPIGPVTIATVDGPREVDALLLGNWALHENNQGWTVTHQRTGYAGKSYPTPIEALVLLGVYLGAGLRIPDDLTAETIGDGFKAIPGIADVAGRVKEALVVLEGWDLDIDEIEP